jgi:imidazole glycerol-phosphate synthase subunit HisH
MKLALIDYGSGNVHSAAKALERAARDADISLELLLTADPDVVATADRIVLPGVGAFRDCREGLQCVTGLEQALTQAVRNRAVPFLGICVGMQMLATRGLEHGETLGLNWIAGDVVPLTPNDPALKIPHMGWNTLNIQQPHPIFEGINSEEHVYFVHSYALRASDAKNVLATTDYGGAFPAIVAHGSIVGTQFHPEKSQAVGLRLLRNFLKWVP